jgi:carboxymethylenebutenolidase
MHAGLGNTQFMEQVSIPSSKGAIPGILALPEGGAGPGVIVIQEWWGIVPHIENILTRLAGEGFVALAIDHYRGVATTEPDEASKLMMGLHIADVATDFSTAGEWLSECPEVASPAIGVIGFCMGGGLALLAPTVCEQISTAIAFYPVMPWPDYDPDWAAYAGKSALIHKAESDERAHGRLIAEYVSAISSQGGNATVIDYPGSVHAFFNDERPEVFQADNAAIAWSSTLAFLRACLSAATSDSDD